MTGKKKSKNNADGGLAALAIVIIAFFRDHPWLIALVVLGVICFFVIKYKNRQKYLRQFYDRDARLMELSSKEHFDAVLTNAINQAAVSGTTVSVGKACPEFHNINKTAQLMFQSSDIIHSTPLSSSKNGRALTAENGIRPVSDPIVLRYTGENNGGYVFYVFPETVLAFVEGPEKVVFLAAYKHGALSLICTQTSKYVSVIVQEKSQNPIRYYDKFCPVQDAEIISSKWEVCNADGSRSFRGGLLPEHNPLHFELKYGKLTVKFGNYSAVTSFSRYTPTAAFVAMFEKYKDSLTN